ncbi:MAG: hydroxyethylthiazole kinase [Micrococcaceae bacterium]|nr:hydroxyethylthiazole kinase [Micrococcaceae bacterium]
MQTFTKVSSPHTVAQVRQTEPLVHCITAAVSMQLVADGLLAAGARPVMTETASEAPSMTHIADTLLINLGTLSTDALAAIPDSVAVAADRGIPWVLDPTAVGVAPVRTKLAKQLIADGPTVIRGNPSEILALDGSASGRGADATHTSAQAHDTASRLAVTTGSTISVSGDTDLIVSSRQQASFAGGTRLLPRITGTGCLLGALTAACLAVEPSPVTAAHVAASWLGTAGEMAAVRSSRPGTFKIHLLDALDELGEMCGERE